MTKYKLLGFIVEEVNDTINLYYEHSLTPAKVNGKYNETLNEDQTFIIEYVIEYFQNCKDKDNYLILLTDE